MGYIADRIKQAGLPYTDLIPDSDLLNLMGRLYMQNISPEENLGVMEQRDFDQALRQHVLPSPNAWLMRPKTVDRKGSGPWKKMKQEFYENTPYRKYVESDIQKALRTRPQDVKDAINIVMLDIARGRNSQRKYDPDLRTKDFLGLTTDKDRLLEELQNTPTHWRENRYGQRVKGKLQFKVPYQIDAKTLDASRAYLIQKALDELSNLESYAEYLDYYATAHKAFPKDPQYASHTKISPLNIQLIRRLLKMDPGIMDKQRIADLRAGMNGDNDG